MAEIGAIVKYFELNDRLDSKVASFELRGSKIVNPEKCTECITLPVRPFDSAIHYGRDGCKVLRAPTVLIATNFAKLPRKEFRGSPSKDAIWIRDNGVDQYTGKR